MSFYFFGAAPQNGVVATIPYDLQIQKMYPGIELEPTEANGLYTEFREVNGVSWWVVNANWNPTSLQWEQDDPANAATPAFAVTQDTAGYFTRKIAPATVIPGDPVIWTDVYSIAPNGEVTIHPNTETAQGQIADQVLAAWNAGTSAKMIARQIDITDTSSSSTSLLDNLEVNGVPVWSVRKDGTLVAGIVPFSAINFPNPTTFNVPVTFTQPVTMTDGLTVTGGETVDHIHVTGNEQVDGTLDVGGATTLHGGLTVAGGIGTDTLNVSGDETVGGNLHVVGNEQLDGDLHVNGNETVGGDLDVGGTVKAAQFEDAAGHAGSTVPAYISAGFTSPAVGSSVAISIASSYAFEVGQTVVVADASVATSFSGTVTAGNGFPATQITVQAEFYYQGTSGTGMTTNGHVYLGSGAARITSADSSIGITRTINDVDLSVQAAPVAPGSWFIKTEFHLPGVGTTGGGVSLGPLPGPSSKTYRIVYWGVAALKDASSNITVTGTPSSGVTWDEATSTYFNGQANAFPFMYFGTAVGGSTPALTWACAPGEYIFQTPFFATMAAGIEL